MRHNTLVLFACGLATMSVAAARGAGQDLPPELAGFSVAVERTLEGFELKCDAGCAWKNLRYPCVDDKKCSSTVDANGFVTDDDKRDLASTFVFTVDVSAERIVVACKRGCAWTTLAFFDDKIRYAWKFNQFGKMKAAE
jgi:hypothetical protein